MTVVVTPCCVIKRTLSSFLPFLNLVLSFQVGTGYSFTKSDAGYAKNEYDVGENLYRFVSVVLEQVLLQPEF